MKTRIWIALTLVLTLVVSSAIVSPASAGSADDENFQWTVSGKGTTSGPNGDDGDDSNGGDTTEGDPENWLGGQNRPVDTQQDDGGLPTLRDLWSGFLRVVSFGFLR